MTRSLSSPHLWHNPPSSPPSPSTSLILLASLTTTGALTACPEAATTQSHPTEGGGPGTATTSEFEETGVKHTEGPSVPVHQPSSASASGTRELESLYPKEREGADPVNQVLGMLQEAAQVSVTQKSTCTQAQAQAQGRVMVKSAAHSDAVIIAAQAQAQAQAQGLNSSDIEEAAGSDAVEVFVFFAAASPINICTHTGAMTYFCSLLTSLRTD